MSKSQYNKGDDAELDAIWKELQVVIRAMAKLNKGLNIESLRFRAYYPGNPGGLSRGEFKSWVTANVSYREKPELHNRADAELEKHHKVLKKIWKQLKKRFPKLDHVLVAPRYGNVFAEGFHIETQGPYAANFYAKPRLKK
ncbi:MAG: hypothetical protein ACOZAO_04095 [Patescibacteria group bacterium]